MPVPIAVHDPLPLLRCGLIATLRRAGFVLTLDGAGDWPLRRLSDGGAGATVIALLPDAGAGAPEQAVLAGADGVLARGCTPQAPCEAVPRASEGLRRTPST